MLRYSCSFASSLNNENTNFDGSLIEADITILSKHSVIETLSEYSSVFKIGIKETKYVDGEGNEEEDKKLSLFDKINNELLLGENNSINLQENPVTTGSDVTINPIDYPSESELTADVAKKEELEEYEEFEGLFYNETMLYPFIEDPFNRSDAQLKDVITSFVTKEENMENSNRDLSSSHILPILSSHNYNNNTIPVLFNDLPVFVMVSLDIIDISSFNMQTMDYVIDVLLNLKWMDFRFARKNKKTIRIGEKTILERIWSPDIYFVNAKRSYFHKITFPNHRMRIESDGTVTYTLRLTLQPSCNMNFEKFPHDHQRCDLQLSSIAYSERQIKLLWFQESFKIINPPTLPEFKLMSVTANECLTQERLIPSSCLRLGFSLKRDSAKYFVEKYIPSTLAMMFAWVAPYVPYNYEDVRIVTPITILLALVQMQKGDEETRISYLTSLDKWFSMMKMFSLISLVESLVVLSLVRKSRALKKKQSKALNDFEREMLIIQERQVKKLYDRIDAMALILSPIIFALYVSYYLTYMVNDSEDYPV
uniref:Neur_chan_LBD domain-containing protein n=1 Tax=Rhabditophanes sp. KR3021 TaxID=114890 RepID=A0AC35U857_9BILA